MPRVIVVQHVPFEHSGTFGDELAVRGVDVATVRLFAGDAIPEDARSADGLVVMGGPMAVYEEHLWPHIADEIRFVRRAVDAEVPVVGICLGSQILAAALGGSVAKGPRKEIGWFTVERTAAAAADPVLRHTPRAWTVFHWHGDQIVPPDGAVVLASSEVTPCQAFRFGDRAYGIQFHPEVTAEIVDGMIGSSADELAEEGIPAEILTNGAARHLEPISAICRRMAAEWAGRWLGVASSDGG